VPSLSSRLHTAVQPFISGNRFDRMDWAGAFGDLGTLIPFVVAASVVMQQCVACHAACRLHQPAR
jgi:hypothetical protein